MGGGGGGGGQKWLSLPGTPHLFSDRRVGLSLRPLGAPLHMLSDFVTLWLKVCHRLSSAFIYSLYLPGFIVIFVFGTVVVVYGNASVVIKSCIVIIVVVCGYCHFNLRRQLINCRRCYHCNLRP